MRLILLKVVSVSIVITYFISMSFNMMAQEVIYSVSNKYRCSYVLPDSILIENLSKLKDTVLFYPDTALVFTLHKLAPDPVDDGFFSSNCFPNPMKTETQFDIFVKQSDDFELRLFTSNGLLVDVMSLNLCYGFHNFSCLSGSNSSYILSVSSSSEIKYHKIVQIGSEAGGNAKLVYNGLVQRYMDESDNYRNDYGKFQYFYEYGDELKFTSYVNTGFFGDINFEMVDNPLENKNYSFDIENFIPVQPDSIYGPQIVCLSTDTVYYNVSNDSSYSYDWHVPMDWTIISGQGSYEVSVLPGTESGVITVSKISGCGSSPEKSIYVELRHESEAVVSIVGNTDICTGETIELEIDGGSLGTDASWQWYSGNCGETSIGTGVSVVVQPESSASYFVRAEGFCNTTDCAATNIIVWPFPDSIINSNSPICEGSDLNISLSDGLEWYWTGPGDFTSSEQNINIESVSTSNSGTYYVTVTGHNGCSSSSDVDIVVNTYSLLPTEILGETEICAGETVQLDIIGGILGTNASWQWYSGNCGETIIGSGESFSAIPEVSDSYYIRAEGLCNTTECLPVNITVLPIPNAQINSNSPVCENAELTLSLPSGSSWNWSGPGGFVSTEQSLVFASAELTNAGIYSVTITGENNCTNSSNIEIIVYTFSEPPSIINGVTDLCQGVTTRLFLTDGVLGGDANWIWYSDACGLNQVGSGDSFNITPDSSIDLFVRAEGFCNTTECVEVSVNVTPFSCPETTTDIDGNVYPVVQIGCQCWLAQNLKTKHYNDNTPIPNVTVYSDWMELETGAYCYYGNNMSNGNWGLLYNWYVASSDNICPTGWRSSTIADWSELYSFLYNNGYGCGSNVYETAKSIASKTGWNYQDPNDFECSIGWYPSQNNSTGFNAFPTGKRAGYDGEFYSLHDEASFWTSDDISEEYARLHYLLISDQYIESISSGKEFGLSIRCVKE